MNQLMPGVSNYREFLDFGSWVLAALATLYVYRADWFNNTLSSNFSSLFFSLWIVFLFFLVIFLLVASILERGLDFSVGPIDKAFGFSYGLVRGFLLVGVGAGLTNPLILDEPESAGESMASA